jgi:hypothetical protein
MPEVKWTLIDDSSQVAAAAHDGSDLFVRFMSGGVYKYHRVPQGLFVELLRSPSKGGFIAKHVKGAYEYERIG